MKFERQLDRARAADLVEAEGTTCQGCRH